MDNMKERQVELWKDMEENSVEIQFEKWKDMESMEENIEKIWKMRKKIVKWYGNYRRKASWIVKRYEKYVRK